LREKGIAARLDISARNLKGQFKYADRLGARYTLVLGEEELTAEVATVKDMKSGDQKKVPFHELATFLAAAEGEESGSKKE
jgi:histidyl-tRNA synthetase